MKRNYTISSASTCFRQETVLESIRAEKSISWLKQIFGANVSLVISCSIEVVVYLAYAHNFTEEGNLVYKKPARRKYFLLFLKQ